MSYRHVLHYGLIVMLSALTLRAQDWDETPTMGDYAYEAFGSWVQIRGMKTQMAIEIRNARAAYWATYPDKPGFEQAQAAYRKAMSARDVYQLNLQVGEGEGADLNRAVMAITPAQGDEDLQVPFAARPAFNRWMREMRRHVDFSTLNPENAQARFSAALQKSATSYLAYLKERDREEWRFATRVPPKADVTRWQVESALLWLFERRERSGEKLPGEPLAVARAWYADCVRQWGQARVSALAEARLGTGVLNANWGIPPEFGSGMEANAGEAFLRWLGTDSPKNFLLAVLMLEQGNNSLTPWRDAQNEYMRWQAKAGSEAALLQEVEKLRAAEKAGVSPNTRIPRLARPQALGSSDATLLGTLAHLVRIGPGGRALVDRAWQEIELKGPYVVWGRKKGRDYSGLLTLTPVKEGEYTVVAMIRERGVTRELRGTGTREGTGREARFVVTYSDRSQPPLKYSVEQNGKVLRSNASAQTEELTEQTYFRSRQTVQGRYKTSGSFDYAPIAGSVTITPAADNTFIFEFDQTAPARRLKVKARWNGGHIERAGDTKKGPPVIYSVLAGGGTLIAESDTGTEILLRLE